MPPYTCWNQNPSKCTNYFQDFLKKLAIRRVSPLCVTLWFGGEETGAPIISMAQAQSRTQSNACSRVRVGIGSGETESICVRFLTQRLSY